MSKSELRPDEGFEAFYNRHWQYLYRLCFTYMKSQADAEDCAEDVFVKVLNGDTEFNDETHERKWLTVTAVNLCKDKLKSKWRRDVGSLDDEPEAAADEAEDYSDVLTAVINLPTKYKDVILMYYYDGYSTDEIAAMLNSPPSTIRNRLKDARNRLKKELGGEYGDR